VVRIIETFRAYALLLTAPLTLAWAGSLGVAVGPLVVMLHACGLLLVMGVLVRSEHGRGAAPRLGIVRDRESVSEDALEAGLPALWLLTAGQVVGLLIARPWMGLASALWIGGAVWWARSNRRSKYALTEVIAPVVLLIGPAMLLRAPAWRGEESGVISGEALAGAFLAGVALGLVILLALARDRVADLAAGLETTATRLGRTGSAALVWGWALTMMTLASMGAGAGWWHWSAAALAAWAGVCAIGLVSLNLAGVAVIATTLLAGAACVVVGATVG